MNIACGEPLFAPQRRMFLVLERREEGDRA